MRALLATCLAVALAACSFGPDEAVLRKDVAERLTQALPAGTVTLASFDRRGSQSDTKAPSGETRRIIYFDTALKLDRDFDFGAWDSPGVAGMVSALGTGPKGIVGLESGGNKAGDMVRAHGTALYKRDGGRWAAVTSGGYSPSTAPAYATGASPVSAIAILDAMRKVIESVPKDASPAARAVIEQELAVANATIRARLARATDGYAIAAGPEHGQYLRFVQALSDGTSMRTIPLVTRGGEENLKLLRAGKVSIALAQGDASLAAYEGKGNFAEDGPYAVLRAAGSLYPEPVHVLLRGDSTLASVADLAGKRVAIGQQGSASRTTALRVLEAHGVRIKDLGQALELPLNAALIGLRHGQVDAVIQVIGAPADSVRDALAEFPLRLLPLSERAVAALAAAKAGYFPITLPRGSYATQRQDVRTIATAALLLVGSDLSATEVSQLTRYVYEKGRDLAARGSAQGVQVSPANAPLGLSVPLHTSAAKVLEELAPASASPKPAAASRKKPRQ